MPFVIFGFIVVAVFLTCTIGKFILDHLVLSILALVLTIVLGKKFLEDEAAILYLFLLTFVGIPLILTVGFVYSSMDAYGISLTEAIHKTSDSMYSFSIWEFIDAFKY